MKRFLTIIAIVVAVLPLVACTMTVNGKASNKAGKNITRQVSNVSYFNKIVTTGAVDIKFVQGSKNAVTIRGTKRLVDNIAVKVDDKTKTLTVSMTNKKRIVLGKNDKAEVRVTSPDLIAVDLRGAGDFESERPLDTDNLNVTISGAGDVDFKSVVCDKAYFTIRGAGDVDVDKLTAKHTDITLQGAGDVDIDFYNSGSVNCTLLGAGDIELEGNVKSLNKKSNGVGNIKTNKLRIER